jgi:hypothetical protein
MTSRVGLNCPINFSPSEHLLEICYGYHGVSKIEEMMIDHNLKYEGTPIKNINKISNENLKLNFFCLVLQVYYLWCRALKSLAFNWLAIGLQIGTYTLIPIIVSIVYTFKIGRSSGCPYRSADGNITQEIFTDEIKTIQYNYSFLFFGLLLFSLGPMISTVLTFPLEMNVISNKRTNKWYNFWSYFIG